MTYDNDTQLSPTCLEHQYADGQVSNRLVPTMNAALEADQGPVRLSRTRPQVEL